MKKVYFLLSFILFGKSMIFAQTYCEPTFLNGCSNWKNLNISLGTINWTYGADACTVSDYTSDTTDITPGVAMPMVVENGTWCGVAIYLDSNNDGLFDTIENLHHEYTGGSPSYVYNFDVTFPDTLQVGNYRMRVIASWGSDGYTPGANGFGGCGDYQYGNFDDFIVRVADATVYTKKSDLKSAISVFPNPSTQNFKVISPNLSDIFSIKLFDSLGREILSRNRVLSSEQISINDIPNGVYYVKVSRTEGNFETFKLVKN